MGKVELVKFSDLETIAVIKKEETDDEFIRIRWNDLFDTMIVSLGDGHGNERDIRSFEVQEDPINEMQLHSMMMSIVMWAQETIFKGPVN